MRSTLCACVMALVAAVVFGAGCAKPQPPVEPAKDYTRQLPPGAPALRKITDPARLPDFRPAFEGDRAGLLKAIAESEKYLSKGSSKKYYPVQTEITHERVVKSLQAFRDLLASASSPDDLQERIVSGFNVYESVGCDDEGTVLFTGYYTPIFDGSLTQTETFKYPLYKMPADLAKNDEGECVGRKMPDGSTVQYYTRGEIDGGAIKGNEIVWLKDRFDAYVCTVQGSAHIRLPDGALFKLGYAANNGKAYTSIGMALVEEGAIPKGQISLLTLTKYFQANPQRLDDLLPRNERYVFFQKADAEPVGCLNVPVTPYRSIATDKSLFPRGALALAATQIPLPQMMDAPKAVVTRPFTQFVLDQDAGGAIRAAGRCDIYLGIGDEAGQIAGWTVYEGRLYYLLVKEAM